MTIQFHGEPRILPLIALRGYTVLPGSTLGFEVGRDASIKALEACVEHDQMIFLVAQRDIRVENPKQSDLWCMGTISKVKQMLRLPGNNIRVLCEGVSRALLLRLTKEEPFLLALAGEVEVPETKDTVRSRALVRAVREEFEKFAEVAPPIAKDVVLGILGEEDPGKLADFIAANLNIPMESRQMVLEELNPEKRLGVLFSILRRETEIARTEATVQARVKEQMDKNQRDYYLREQLKAIRTELGDKDDLQGVCEEYTDKIKKRALPAEVSEKLLTEVDRLSHMVASTPEASVLRTYIDTCLKAPWEIETKDKFDVSATEKVLEAEHFGLSDVKKRILEYVAVHQFSDKVKSQIICLVGPPGTGKTSIAISVAHALKRKYARVSLGGVSDEAEIRGHRRTYIGAMPGRIISAISNAGSKNCVLVLDEVDKIGKDYKGDPFAALLEVLDPEQNSTFRDNYMELPFDLSKVLFVLTANTMDTIPKPLLDRMEVIEVSGYTDEEKLNIAKRHLVKKQLSAHGLNGRTLKITDGAIRALIRGYTRESGVRSLEREIAAICRKSVLLMIQENTASLKVSEKELENMLGAPRYIDAENLHEDQVGIVNGLAYTSVGGEMLQVEVNLPDGDGKLQLTGNLGEVMKESAMAAISCIRSYAVSLGIDPEFYKKKDIHIHFPEGAVPKDGPSAGVTIFCALVSALTGRPASGHIAMTGEITLRGRVLPIGGLKEKTMAAYREGMATVLIPWDNRKDLEKIDPTVRMGLKFIPIKTGKEALEILLAPVKSEMSDVLCEPVNNRAHREIRC